MRTRHILPLLVVILLASASPAFAYVGPGAGLSVIGAALAFVGAIFLAIVGFIWYPIKRLFFGRTSRKVTDTSAVR